MRAKQIIQAMAASHFSIIDTACYKKSDFKDPGWAFCKPSKLGLARPVKILLVPFGTSTPVLFLNNCSAT